MQIKISRLVLKVYICVNTTKIVSVNTVNIHEKERQETANCLEIPVS